MTDAIVHTDSEELLVVRVEDDINPALTGRTGARYDSPPQPPEQARALVRLLLGWPTQPRDGQTQWRCPVAGGTRTVTLAAVQTSQSGADAARRFASHRPPTWPPLPR